MQDISDIIKEKIDNFDIVKDKTQKSIKVHEVLIFDDPLISEKIMQRFQDCGIFACAVSHDERGIHITAIDPHDHTDIVNFDYDPLQSKENIFSMNPYKSRHHVSANTLPLIEELAFSKLDTLKENHPYGWYRKFEKKRF